ncbi:MBL fold metallo-hydrolase [Methylobrevis pamukkalensis]|uniref:MBL fold metallo-hydrolase n=1 Tax=Methylobrevis pamukkalensis TaxID=1439726 RepID=UPI001FD9249B|nr:MBL fold metallo-hydrolase [Methylobrevis pamukkalensis]
MLSWPCPGPIQGAPALSDPAATLRILAPSPGVFAYYDGRVPGVRLHAPTPNWLDDGAYALGIASYAIVDGDEALIYDTHITLAHARAIRAHLDGLGVRRLRVVLSHWHDDHVAGNVAFADGEILALERTAELLAANRARLEAGDPPIAPLVMPTRTFSGALDLTVGRRAVQLRHFEIHSADGCVLLLPDAGLLLAGDTVEDTVTYVSEAERTAVHIDDLTRLAALRAARILPNHGAPERIAAGGYDTRLIDANRSYLQRLLAVPRAGEAVEADLATFVADDLASGAIGWFAPYQAVHEANVGAMSEACLAAAVVDG